MSIEFADLLVNQAKHLAVMFCAGIVVGSLRQAAVYAKTGARSAKSSALCIAAETAFWIAAAATVSMFLYYASYGRLTLYGVGGFFAGLLLCRKKGCDIIKGLWVEKEEAENSKTTAGSSALKMPENKGWKKGGQRRKKRKKK